MRRSKEIMILFVLLVGAMGFVLWYVIDRRARMQAPPPVAARPVTPAPPKRPAGTPTTPPKP
ncbi:MAG TPA: hypothetical protein VKC51_02370 [Lacunisphaera sp.]|nr:hypothetical protein [Lacunisphaera sp.]